MTIRRRIFWSIISTAAFLNITLGAQETCPPTPEKYRQVEFGDTRFAVEEGCRRTFTQTEHGFLSGVAQALSSKCKLPRDRDGRAMVNRFLKASTLALGIRQQDGPLPQTIPSQPDFAAAFAAGESMTEEIRCNGPEAALLSRGITIFLKRTSGRSLFVDGCVESYAGRYTEKHCRCMADTLRPRLRDIDQRYFDREIIRQSIHDSPTVAVSLMFSCGVANY